MATSDEAIQAAKLRLQTAYFGLLDMRTDKNRFESGLMNAVVFGKMVTLSLQNMRSTVAEFDDWYAPFREQMAADRLMKFFWNLRNTIEKRADPHAGSRISLNFSGTTEEIFGNPPPRAVGAFIDQEGRSGWKVQLPDGTLDDYFVQLPDGFVNREAVLIDAPEEFCAIAADNLIEQYLTKLSYIVDEAEKRFG